jgi:hypothetical protein
MIRDRPQRSSFRGRRGDEQEQMRQGMRTGFTHEKPEAERDTRSSNCEASPVAKGAAISKPKRVVAEQTPLLEQSHA